jgi:hypothetical protein
LVKTDERVPTDITFQSFANLVGAAHNCPARQFLSVHFVAKTDQTAPFLIRLDHEMIATFVAIVAMYQINHFIPGIQRALLIDDDSERRFGRNFPTQRRLGVSKEWLWQNANRRALQVVLIVEFVNAE